MQITTLEYFDIEIERISFSNCYSFINELLIHKNLEQLNIQFINLLDEENKKQEFSFGESLYQKSKLNPFKLHIESDQITINTIRFHQNLKFLENLTLLKVQTQGLNLSGFDILCNSINEYKNFYELELILLNQIPNEIRDKKDRQPQLGEYQLNLNQLKKLSILIKQCKAGELLNKENNIDELKLLFFKKNDCDSENYENLLLKMMKITKLQLYLNLIGDTIPMNSILQQISKMTELEQLSLTFQFTFKEIEGIQQCFQGLKKVTSLSLQFNESHCVNTECLLSSLKYFKNLTTLSLGVQSLPKDLSLEPLIQSFQQLPNLQYLTLLFRPNFPNENWYELDNKRGKQIIESLKYLTNLNKLNFTSDINNSERKQILENLNQILISLKHLNLVFISFKYPDCKFLKRKLLRMVMN